MASFLIVNYSSFTQKTGGLAQLARAPALQAGGQRFESVILHKFRNLPEAFMKEELSWTTKKAESKKAKKEFFDMMDKTEKRFRMLFDVCM